MKDFLDKLGLAELFAYLFPGGILLSSLLLWVSADDLPVLLRARDGWQLVGVGAVLLIVSYSLGLIVSSVSTWAAALCWRKAGRHYAEPRPLRWLGLFLLDLLGGVPRPQNKSFRTELTRISASLTRLVRLSGLASTEVPWERLVAYRAILTDRVGDKAKTAIAEADSLHRRFLFAQAVGLVGALLAFQGVARLVTLRLGWGEDVFPPVYRGWLIALILVGALSSLALRWTAGRWWEAEFVLTCSLTRLAESARRSEIEARAHRKWELRGKPAGSPEQDWRDAAREIAAEEKG